MAMPPAILDVDAVAAPAALEASLDRARGMTRDERVSALRA